MTESIQDAIRSELKGSEKGPDHLFGLAFSGGGIRSATFNLGVLERLEQLKLLPFVDYLSTVSGGGYIGSWYLACRKDRLKDAEQRRRALDHLRQSSNYLAPKTGFFSADTWTIAMVWLRNTILLQSMLVSLFALLLLLPRFLEWGFTNLPANATSLAALVLFAIAAVQIVYRLARMRETDKEGESADRTETRVRPRMASFAKFIPNRLRPKQARESQKGPDAQGWLQVTVLVPLLVAAACFASALWRTAGAARPDLWTLPVWEGGAVAAATWLAAWYSLLYSVRGLAWLPGIFAIGCLSGALVASLGYATAQWYASLTGLIGHSQAQWLAGMTGAPMMLAALGLAVVLQIGLLGRAIDDSRREWWSRLGAFLAIYSVAALTLGSAAVYAPWLADFVMKGTWVKWLSGSVTLGGITAVWRGLAAARSPDTGGEGGNSNKEMLAKLAPFVFIAGLLIFVSAGLNQLLAVTMDCKCQFVWQTLDWSISSSQMGELAIAAAISAAALLLLAWRVDINEASMNPFYRNRLVRCYLGAARAALGRRRPNLFTGFDFADDFGLVKLRAEEGYDGPVPIINTTLNLTGGENAALEERRATSFFFTPYRSGSTETGCQKTEHIGKFATGIRLGSCVATSGAAVSPNMGFHTSAPVAFLMTFFNVRLGLWLRSPKAGPGKQLSRWGLWYLLKELFATADVNDRYIYLSDGGHFENLGVYELIRRRCRYILACDAEEDPNLVLEGLGNLVRKARIDFGAEIVIDTSQIRQRDENARSRAHCAVGRIHYDGNPNEAEAGYLIYLKASLTGDEVSDVLQYKAQHAAFPHESTADQFFSESQFESYRALGDHIVEKAFARQKIPARRGELESLMQAMSEDWALPSRFTEEHFAHHAEQLNRLWDEIRKDPDLAYLDPQLFPDWAKARADPHDAGFGGQRRGLYLGQTILQLMENVYLDLHLDTESEHVDNQGWMRLFRRWAASSLVQQAYELSEDTYGDRFRKFCQQELKFPPREAKAATP